MMNTRCGASAADRFPIAGKAASWRVRPCESRAVVPVLFCTMCVPSVSVCVDSFVIVAEYGAPCTGALIPLPITPAVATTDPAPWYTTLVLMVSCPKAHDDVAKINTNAYFMVEFLSAQIQSAAAAAAFVVPNHPLRYSDPP